MIILWVIAAWHRLKVVNEAIIGSDSLGPYLQAQSALFGHMPRPPNPESGDALWILSLPLIAVSQSLEMLFQMRFIAGALIAPIAFSAAWHWVDDTEKPTTRWAAAVASGLFVAFDPGLLDTLVSGARSYMAPELIGVFILSLALSLKGNPLAPFVAVISLVAAAGAHPMAIGMGLSIFAILGPLHRVQGGRRLRQAAIIGGLVAIPRLWGTIKLAFCGQGITACLAKVAQSNVDGQTQWQDMLTTAIHDRWLVDMGFGVWVLGLGVGVLCLGRVRRRLGLFVLLGYFGILAVGLSQGYVRSYHLRIIAVPISVGAAIGLARVPALLVFAVGLFVFKTAPMLPVGPDIGAASRHDQIASSLGKHPVWVDRVWWDGPPLVDASAVVLSAWMAGHRSISLGKTTPIAVVQCSLDDGWSVQHFSSSTQAASWLQRQSRQAHQVGGAYDWATIVAPQTRLEDARW
jgi:hypothetical protein